MIRMAPLCALAAALVLPVSSALRPQLERARVRGPGPVEHALGVGLGERLAARRCVCCGWSSGRGGVRARARGCAAAGMRALRFRPAHFDLAEPRWDAHGERLGVVDEFRVLGRLRDRYALYAEQVEDVAVLVLSADPQSHRLLEHVPVPDRHGGAAMDRHDSPRSLTPNEPLVTASARGSA